ncbi:amidohydrolase family protein [Mycobacterium sp. CVI_P3]|uniref:Amidohydrolase family protein n=1 Tax=Mycobacterium pinniadriaticum TaxID=2994102 RepID=A0ABT3S942_9MYCO|nr:amidohydrolase family protein [Mycobacterium pinniadriaticum]MCX2929607.1 amidohydrolase family protein [Mycobacterium pinniadriaticum]MCX2936031.1 amidohydrolase family protein [Mycobacterium pinniadriaticum]
MAADVSALADRIADVRLVDNHVHGYWLTAGDRRRFENGLNEANIEPLADFDSGFDTQLGFAVRAHCAPLIGLPEHVDPHSYWERRGAMTEDQLAQVFLPAAGVSDWLIDTGLPGAVAGLPEMARSSGGAVGEIVRLEQVAEQAAAAPGDYAAEFRRILYERSANAVATKTVLAYRGGFDGDLSEPDPGAVTDAAVRWRDAGGVRLTDRVLLRFGVHEALRLGKPLQFHVGLGDRDCDLHRTNPLLLLDFLRQSGSTPIVLLHCYPYEREAGYLAQAFNNVYLDVGLSVNHLGARAEAFIARTLELAPFRKILYSSDAFGPAELHYLGSLLWRAGMAAVLTGFVERGQWSQADAIRVVDLIGRDNARRVYAL